MREIDIDLVDASVLDDRCDLRDHVLEPARVVTVALEISAQQDRLWAALGRLHEPHGRMHAELARRVAGRGHDAATHIIAQAREAHGGRCDGALGAAAADHHGLADELWVAQ